MSLSKSLILAAKKIVLGYAVSTATRSTSANLIVANKTNKDLCELLDVGEVVGKNVHLSPQDIRDIEIFFDAQLGERLITYDITGDTRMAMARPGMSEKSASGTVFQSLINVASKAAIYLHGQPHIPVAARYIASIKSTDLILETLTHVVVLENGEMIVEWETVANALPDAWQNALLVYRGHGENQKELKSLIDLLFQAKVKVALFFDYDAAGLEMAYHLFSDQLFSDQKNAYLVVPDAKIEALIKLSKEESFACQHGQLNRLIHKLNHPNTSTLIATHANTLKQHQLAVTQEHLLHAQITLKLAPFFSLK